MPKTVASIVMPILDQRPHFLKRAFASLSQTVPIESVIVTSRHSPPNVRTLVKELCARSTAQWIEQSRPGFGAAVNEGIQDSSLARFGLLLSDDWLDPDAVEAGIGINADIVSTGMLIHDGRGTPRAKRVPTSERLACMDHSLEIANCLTHFLLFDREVVTRVGMLDELIGDSPGVDDFDLLWKLLEHSATFAVTGRPLYHDTDHGGMRLTLNNKRDILRTFDRILDKHNVDPDLRRRLHRDHAEWFGIRILPKMRKMLSEL